MAHSTCQAALKSLQEKLAIKCEGQIATHADGKTYLVFSYREILEFRRSVGLTHYVKATKGVKLVGVPNGGVPDFGQRTESQRTGITGFGVSDFGAHPNRETSVETVGEPSSTVSVIVDAFNREGLSIDDAGARDLLAACRALDRAATAAEAAHFVGVKLEQIRSRRDIANRQGLVLSAVPRYFEPPATELRLVREIWRGAGN